jgi:hypothetical protein
MNWNGDHIGIKEETRKMKYFGRPKRFPKQKTCLKELHPSGNERREED